MPVTTTTPPHVPSPSRGLASSNGTAAADACLQPGGAGGTATA